MRIEIKSAGRCLYRYESVLKDYGSLSFTNERGEERSIIEIENLSDLKELSMKLNSDLILAKPYDKYFFSNKVQVELGITIYDDYIE